MNDQHNIVSDLDCFSMEEADFRMIVHAQHSAAHGFTKLVFVTSDTDVFILFLFHWKRLHLIGIQALWIRTGIGDSTRIIPVHVLVKTLGPELCSVLPAVHALTEADYTSKFGTKKAGLNCNPVQFLTNFGISVDDCNMMNSMKKADEYLVQLWKRGSNCQTLDQLRLWLYHQTKTGLALSRCTKGHLLRAYYHTYFQIHCLDNRS